MDTLKPTLFHELLIAWKWASIVFGNILALVLFLTWWQGQSWVRADNGAVIEMSQGMSKAMKR